MDIRFLQERNCALLHNIQGLILRY